MHTVECFQVLVSVLVLVNILEYLVLEVSVKIGIGAALIFFPLYTISYIHGHTLSTAKNNYFIKPFVF